MEEYFTGCDRWLTGIETLDAQHVELAACISRVVNGCCCSENTQTGGSVSRKQNLSELVGHVGQPLQIPLRRDDIYQGGVHDRAR